MTGALFGDPDLSAPTASLWRLLEAFNLALWQHARSMGLNFTDLHALCLLDVHGPMGPAELGRRLHLRSASVTVLVDRLEALDLVQRRREERDRRRLTLHLSARACDQLTLAWGSSMRETDTVCRALGDQLQDTVTTFLDRVAAVFNDSAGRAPHSAS